MDFSFFLILSRHFYFSGPAGMSDAYIILKHSKHDIIQHQFIYSALGWNLENLGFNLMLENGGFYYYEKFQLKVKNQTRIET